MITAVVTAVAITQREARREKEAKLAEEAAAAKKDILIVGASIHGLIVGLLCRLQGFTVTIVEQEVEDSADLSDDDGICVLGPTALRVLRKIEGLAEELAEGAVDTKVCGFSICWRGRRGGGLMRRNRRYGGDAGAPGRRFRRRRWTRRW